MTYKRKVQIGDATLYLGDCLEVMPGLGKVDCVLTDPPYGLGDKWQGGGGGAKSSWNFNPSEAQSWDGKTSDDAINYAISISQDKIIWGGNYYSLPVSRCWLVWDKGQPDTWTTGQCELAWTNLDRPVRAFRMCQAVAHGEMRPKRHPTQKPLKLIKWCLKWTNAETVLDPFMGSGTTGVACAKLGRKFIGIEIDEGYFDIACERIRKAYDQPDLFIAPPEPKQVQEAFI